MSQARASLRLLGLVLLTLALLPAGLLVRAAGVLRWGPVRVASLRGLLALQRAWCRGVLLVMGVRVRTVGRVPDGTAVVVSNHLSYLDIPVLGSVLPCRFVSKAEVAGWPVVGSLARLAHVVFLQRERRRDLPAAAAAIRASLDARVPVVFFPEGTSTAGAGVLPFHAGLLQPAAEGGVPCQPVALRYETPRDAGSPAFSVCWWGDMTFGGHVWKLLGLRRIEAGLVFAGEPLCHAERKALAAALHARVAAAFVPVPQPPAAVTELASPPDPRQAACPT